MHKYFLPMAMILLIASGVKLTALDNLVSSEIWQDKLLIGLDVQGFQMKHTNAFGAFGSRSNMTSNAPRMMFFETNTSPAQQAQYIFISNRLSGAVFSTREITNAQVFKETVFTQSVQQWGQPERRVKTIFSGRGSSLVTNEVFFWETPYRHSIFIETSNYMSFITVAPPSLRISDFLPDEKLLLRLESIKKRLDDLKK